MSETEPADAFGFLRSFLAHRSHVSEGIRLVCSALESRANEHDLSKLADDEFAGYCRINAGVRDGAVFGSPEYRELMGRERPTIDLHFTRNRHHPERPRLIAEIDVEPDDYRYATALAAEAMTFVDVIEMVVDWWAARKGYGDTRTWAESFELNLKAKGKYLSDPQLWLAHSVADTLGGAA